MKYQSKKDETIFAELTESSEKYGTATLVYTSGEKEGKSISVTMSTLKRWWRKVGEGAVVERSATQLSEEEVEQINTSYKPDVTPHYIEKPASVVEYEEKKRLSRARKPNTDMPSFVEMKDIYKDKIKRCNDSAHYITLTDGTNLNRSAVSLVIRATNDVAVKLSTSGLEALKCNEGNWKFRYVIKSGEDFDKVKNILMEEN